VIHWLHKHAEDKLGADSELMTISGFSAGGTLAVAASQIPECQPPKPTAIKATVTFYAPVRFFLRYSIVQEPCINVERG
jgi:acetyl esterase/lipase